jgi:SAM-dependent methyltransferase
MPNQTEKSYDVVAQEYTRRIYDELRHKPLDRLLLSDFARRLQDAGLVCDLGCGPGQVAAYLRQLNVTVEGLDISSSMIEEARRLNPSITFIQHDMLDLKPFDCRWSGVVAFYSIIHVAREDLRHFLAGVRECLKSNGLFLLSFHKGNSTLSLTEWWGYAVDVTFHFHETDEMEMDLSAAGFEVLSVVEREPYPLVEHQSKRTYILARRK